MNTHRISRLRSIGGAAALVILAAAGLAGAAPGMAQPQAGAEVKQERIIIMEHKAGEGGPDGHGNRVMRFRSGPNGEPGLPENCNGGSQPVVNVDEGTGDQRTRVFLCTTGAGDPATRLQRLQQIRERMAAGTETGEHRERVLAAIDRAIAELRAAQ